jgi:Domain of unknown function (DUF6475)
VTDADRVPFAALLSQALGFYRQDVSEFALGVWWSACQPFALEQVRKALTAHALDAERGQFAPKPADIVRQLDGTHTDRSLVAWGAVLAAIRGVGGWQSAAFDDPAIHLAITDMGGWTAICASTIDELPFVQKRFCETHRAYSRRPETPHPPRLAGRFELTNATNGHPIAPPVLIGDRERALRVIASGSSAPRVAMVSADAAVLALEGVR